MMIWSQARATSTAWPWIDLGRKATVVAAVEFLAGEEMGQLVGVA